MFHDSTWLRRTRAGRIGLALPLGLILACVLLASLASSALATGYDMRGEWQFAFTVTGKGVTPGVLTIENINASGEYSGKIVLEGIVSGTVSGTVTDTEVTVNTVAYIPTGTLYFKSTSGTIDTANNTISGEGVYTLEKSGVVEPVGSGPMSGKRTKDYQELKEEEERKIREGEEKSARTNIRGEWALTLKFATETAHAVALVTGEANAKNEFAASSTVFEGVDPGTFAGTLEDGTATVKLTSQAIGTVPPTEFVGSNLTVNSIANPTSITGTGTLTVTTPGGPEAIPGSELTATRIHTYPEVKAREAEEAKEKQEAEEAQAKKAKEAEEAKQAEEAARAKQALEAKQAEEARAKAAREAKEKQERELLAKSATVLPALVSAEPSSKTLSVPTSGSFALELTNPNGYAVQGHFALLAPAASGADKTSARKGKPKTVSLGTGSFSISAHGSETLKLKLSGAGRANLAHRKTLSVTLTLITNAGGTSAVSKTYTLTLHASGSGHRKG